MAGNGLPPYARERWERVFADLIDHPDPDDLREHLRGKLSAVPPGDAIAMGELRTDIEATLALISHRRERFDRYH